MPKSKPRARAPLPPEPLAESLQQRADTLYRTAAECCRQRRRYARLVEGEASDAEQAGARRLVDVCDELLVATAAEYENGAPAQGESRSTREGWRRRAAALWLACREYARRRDRADGAATRLTSHGQTKLSEIAVDYDLAASALLGLQHAVDAYRKERPEADLSHMTAKV
jgi:hypothetical protein